MTLQISVKHVSSHISTHVGVCRSKVLRMTVRMTQTLLFIESSLFILVPLYGNKKKKIIIKQVNKNIYASNILQNKLSLKKVQTIKAVDYICTYKDLVNHILMQELEHYPCLLYCIHSDA